jgi:hypothetical protein
LDVNLPVSTSATGGVPVDGTAASNQTNLAVATQPIANWAPGAALWLVWEMGDATGKAQGLAIDNLSFSAFVQSAVPRGSITFSTSATNLVLSWTGVVGQAYQIEFTDDLGASTWTPLGSALTGTGAVLSFTNSLTGATQRFYRVQIVP